MTYRPFVRFFVSCLLLSLPAPLLPQQKPQVIPQETSDLAAVRAEGDARIDALAPRLEEMSLWLHKNPEPGFLEFKASAMLADELRNHGFEVEMGVAGLDLGFDRLKSVG